MADREVVDPVIKVDRDDTFAVSIVPRTCPCVCE